MKLSAPLQEAQRLGFTAGYNQRCHREAIRREGIFQLWLGLSEYSSYCKSLEYYVPTGDVTQVVMVMCAVGGST